MIFECLGHKESVVAAAFSSGSTYVATGDLNGYIQVRNTTTGNKIFDFEIDEINWILWHDSSEYVLLAGTTKGDFWMWNVNDPAAVRTFASYGSSSTAAKLMPDGMKAIVSYQDGSIRMFDLKTQQSLSHFQDPTRSEIISMDLNSKKSILAAGCLDSSIKLLTVGNLKVIGTLACNTPEQIKKMHMESKTNIQSCSRSSDKNDELMDDDDDDDECSHHEKDDFPSEVESEPLEVIDDYANVKVETSKQEIDEEVSEDDYDGDEADYPDDTALDGTDSGDSESVESILFSPCGNLLAAANNSGTIIIWDVSSQVKRCEVHTGVGISRAAWTEDGRYVAGHLDGTVRVYDSSLKESRRLIAHADQILDLEVKKGFVVTASEDKTLRVIKL